MHSSQIQILNRHYFKNKLMKGLRLTSFILMTLGVLVYLIGFVSRIQHWPDILRGKISGQIILLLGVILYLIYLFSAQKDKK